MTLNIFTGFKKPAIITVTILGLWVTASWAVPADLLYQSLPDQKRAKQHPAVIAQNETRTTPQEKTAPPSESSASESKTQEKKESEGAQQKPLKEFRPTERIEAEQAVDFPYDI